MSINILNQLANFAQNSQQLFSRTGRLSNCKKKPGFFPTYFFCPADRKMQYKLILSKLTDLCDFSRKILDSSEPEHADFLIWECFCDKAGLCPIKRHLKIARQFIAG